MKTTINRPGLPLSGLLLVLGMLLSGLRTAGDARAFTPPTGGSLAPETTFHLWIINEIFSCGDGSEQFIELVTNFNGQELLTGEQLRATNLTGTGTTSFTFPADSGSPTANHSLLVATPGFAALPGGVTPDFVIPAGFLFTGGGKVQLVGASTLNYGAGELPLDGVTSLDRVGATATNSPKNFAGQQGQVSCPAETPDPTLSVSKQGPATINPFSLITYTLTVTSSGPLSNTNVVLTDTIPISTALVSATVTPVNGVLTWTLGDMPSPLTVISRTFVVAANASTGTVIVNADYGARSDQEAVTGPPVRVLIPGAAVYLPIIIK